MALWICNKLINDNRLVNQIKFKVLKNNDLKYKNFVEQGKLSELRKMIRECLNQEAHKISGINNSLRPKFIQQIETQICLNRISHLLLNPKIVRRSIKTRNRIGFIYPIHESWITVFVHHGVKVNKILCKALFQIYLIKSLFISYYKFFNYSFKKNSRKSFKIGNIIVQLSSDLSNSTSDFKNSLNFKNWLQKMKFISPDDVLTYFTTTRNNKAENVLYINDIFKSKRIESVKRLILMLRDYPKSSIRYFLKKPDLLFQYLNFNVGLFKNVKMIIVPSSEYWVKQIWHLRAEELGIRVVFVNLSDSADASMTFDNDSPLSWIALSNWQSVVVCSRNQTEAFLKYSSKFVSPEIKLLGVPDWTDFHDERLIGLNNFVAIFDNEPHKGYYGLSSNNDCGYFEIENALKFINDIIQVTSKLNVNCVLKPKRNLSSKKRYIEYFNELRYFKKVYTNFYFLDERVAPRRIIRASLASINLPFTSTGLIAKECRVPTCFYDPVGRINISDPGSSGIKIFNNINFLQIWLDEVIQLKS